VVPERTFQRGVPGLDVTLKNDLGAGRHIKAGVAAVPDPAALAAQQTGEFELGQGVRHRCHRRQQGGRIGTYRNHQREGRVGMRADMVLEIQGAATMRQPAHDQTSVADQLLPIDRDVLARLVRPAGDHQAEADQTARILRPAALDRQTGKIDVIALDHHLVEVRLRHRARRHVCELGQLRPGLQGGLERARPARFFQGCQQRAEFTQAGQRPPSKAKLDAPTMAEQVAEKGMRSWLRSFEQQGRALRAQGVQAQRGGFQLGRHRLFDAQQLPAALKSGEEAAQVLMAHGRDDEVSGRHPAACPLARP
jgi:hypothetical protein